MKAEIRRLGKIVFVHRYHRMHSKLPVEPISYKIIEEIENFIKDNSRIEETTSPKNRTYYRKIMGTSFTGNFSLLFYMIISPYIRNGIPFIYQPNSITDINIFIYHMLNDRNKLTWIDETATPFIRKQIRKIKKSNEIISPTRIIPQLPLGTGIQYRFFIEIENLQMLKHKIETIINDNKNQYSRKGKELLKIYVEKYVDKMIQMAKGENIENYYIDEEGNLYFEDIFIYQIPLNKNHDLDFEEIEVIVPITSYFQRSIKLKNVFLERIATGDLDENTLLGETIKTVMYKDRNKKIWKKRIKALISWDRYYELWDTLINEVDLDKNLLICRGHYNKCYLASKFNSNINEKDIPSLILPQRFLVPCPLYKKDKRFIEIREKYLGQSHITEFYKKLLKET